MKTPKKYSKLTKLINQAVKETKTIAAVCLILPKGGKDGEMASYFVGQERACVGAIATCATIVELKRNSGKWPFGHNVLRLWCDKLVDELLEVSDEYVLAYVVRGRKRNSDRVFATTSENDDTIIKMCATFIASRC